MKKVLATLLAIMLVMSTSLTAFGASYSDVEEKMNGAISYAFDGNYGKDGYDVSDAKDLYILSRTDTDISSYLPAYKDSLNSTISTNGSLTLTQLALAVNILTNAGEDPATFLGSENLLEDLENFDVTKSDSPYGLVYAIEAASFNLLDEKAVELVKQLQTYYTLGTGTDFWGGYGTSVDDLSMFLIGLSYYDDGTDEYQNMIDDAFALIEKDYSDEGYMSYGTPNADSTALALAAYSAYANEEKANDIYDILVDNFYDESTGCFACHSTANKASWDDDYYSTADSLYGLTWYSYIAYVVDDDDETTTSNESTTEATTKATSTSTKSPNTGNSGIGVAASLAVLSLASIAILKRKEN